MMVITVCTCIAGDDYDDSAGLNTPTFLGCAHKHLCSEPNHVNFDQIRIFFSFFFKSIKTLKVFKKECAMQHEYLSLLHHVHRCAGSSG